MPKHFSHLTDTLKLTVKILNTCKKFLVCPSKAR